MKPIRVVDGFVNPAAWEAVTIDQAHTVTIRCAGNNYPVNDNPTRAAAEYELERLHDLLSGDTTDPGPDVCDQCGTLITQRRDGNWIHVLPLSERDGCVAACRRLDELDAFAATLGIPDIGEVA